MPTEMEPVTHNQDCNVSLPIPVVALFLVAFNLDSTDFSSLLKYLEKVTNMTVLFFFWLCTYLSIHTVHWTPGRQGMSREENLRSCGNCRHVYSLWAGTAATQQTYCVLSWLTQQTAIMQSWHRFKGFSVELMYSYRTKVAHGQMGTLWSTYAVLSVISAVT